MLVSCLINPLSPMTHSLTPRPPLATLQTKWVVSAAVFAFLLQRRDLYVAWCVLGSIASSFVCKVCKCV